MVLGGVPADEQGPAYVGVGGAIDEQPQDLKFPGAEDRAGTGAWQVLPLVSSAEPGAGLERSYAFRIEAVFTGEVWAAGQGPLGPGIRGGEHPCADRYPLAASRSSRSSPSARPRWIPTKAVLVPWSIRSVPARLEAQERAHSSSARPDEFDRWPGGTAAAAELICPA